MLFREQGITIVSVLTAIGMAIGILVEVLLPGDGSAAAQGSTADKGGGNGKPENVKEWLRNKFKALALLLGRLGVKAAEVFPGIMGAIICWILNRVKEVVGWILQNL